MRLFAFSLKFHKTRGQLPQQIIPSDERDSQCRGAWYGLAVHGRSVKMFPSWKLWIVDVEVRGIQTVFLVAGCDEQVNDTGVDLLAERAVMQSGRICPPGGTG